MTNPEFSITKISGSWYIGSGHHVVFFGISEFIVRQKYADYVAAEDYILVCKERDRLKQKVMKLEFKHADLVDDIRQGLDAYNRVTLAIGPPK